MKKILGRILITVLILSLVLGTVGGVAYYMSKANRQSVLVAQVEGLEDDYYTEDDTLYGTITTNVSQVVRGEADTTVKEIYVTEGQPVAVGDPLVMFDMTLVNMQLHIYQLKAELLELQLDKTKKRLISLQNGGPIYDESNSDTELDDMDDMDDMDDYDDYAWLDLGGRTGLAMLHMPMFLAEFFSDGGDSDSITAYDPEDDAFSDSDGDLEDTVDDFEGDAFGDSSNQNSLTTDPAISDDYGFDSGSEEDLFTDMRGEDLFSDDKQIFYAKLEYDTEPFEGTGTKNDPFVFLVSSATGKVTATGGFLNRMAGYNEDGYELLHEGGYWYKLEFHTLDHIEDLQDRRKSCQGYYLIDGAFLEAAVNPFLTTEYTLEDALQYPDPEPDPDPDPDPDPYIDPDPTNPDDTQSRKEAIENCKNQIFGLEIAIEENAIKLTKQERKAARETIYSRIDGIVSEISNKTSKSDEEILRVKSKDGFYLRSTVSEMMLDRIQEGTQLNCYSYEVGRFKAEVDYVADYPSENSDNFYMSSNPNSSEYAFTATIQDKSLEFSDMDWIQVSLPGKSAEDMIVLPRAFVRSENGRNYVLKEIGGVLKKCPITTEGAVNWGMDVLVSSGLRKSDYIAFPYGSAVEGVPTKRGSADQVLGYY